MKINEIYISICLTDFPIKYTKLWNERWIRDDLKLPSINRFVCTNFKILNKTSKEVNFPLKIFSSENCDCFFLPDQIFMLPVGYIGICMRSSIVSDSIRNSNILAIYSMMIKDFLSTELFMAKQAGFYFDFHSYDDGIILSVNGFNQKLINVFNIIQDAITNIDKIFDKHRFETFKKQLKKNIYAQIINSTSLIE